MKRLRTAILLIPLLAGMTGAELIVSRDAEGRIVLSNVPKPTFTLKKNRHLKYSFTPLTVPGDYKDKIAELARKFQLQENLIIAVIQAESSFNPYAVSHKGAVGMMQLMKDTAHQYGVEDRFNVDQNLEAGIRHLKYLFEKYEQDLPLTLAAYNAGEEAVARYDGVPPFPETQQYVKRVLKLLGLNYNLPSSGATGRRPSRIYKYTTRDGRVIISDSLLPSFSGQMEVIHLKK